MLPDRLSNLAGVLKARSNGQARVTGISIDSRTVKAGDLFVALKGVRNGHDYIQSARDRGAVAALVSEPQQVLPEIFVDDTVIALMVLARHFRDGFKHPVIAITGSQGKTSTRGFVSSILRQSATHSGHPDILETEGNYNNDLGLPLTAARLREDHAYAVFELGASKAGDIELLAAAIRPNYSVLLNARVAHLEGFGTLSAIVKEKGQIIDYTSPTGAVILNSDEPAFELWKQRAADRKILSFGRQNADVSWKPIGKERVEIILFSDQIKVTLPTLGQHFMENAAAAAAVCHVAGVSVIDIASGLESASIEPRRMTPIRVNDLLVVDDTYNSSPQAVRAAIDWLSEQAGDRLLIMGGLAELGDSAESEMHRLGEYAKSSGLTQLITVGSAEAVAAGFGAGATHFEILDTFFSDFLGLKYLKGTVVVKGSHSERMDGVVKFLTRNKGA